MLKLEMFYSAAIECKSQDLVVAAIDSERACAMQSGIRVQLAKSKTRMPSHRGVFPYSVCVCATALLGLDTRSSCWPLQRFGFPGWMADILTNR